MDFFKRLSFLTLFQKDVIENDFLNKETDKVLNEFDQEYRFKDVNELTYPDREIRTNLLYAATVFWTVVVNASHSIYKKIQILEADYIDVKSQLDNKIEYELENHEKKRQSIEKEIEQVDKDLQEYHAQRKEIEAAYHKVGEEKKIKGSLSRLSGFWFLFIMTIAGLAELAMYKNVFMSQEIGLVADLTQERKFYVELMAIAMATGFTVMIIWLAHKMGELLRHYDSALESEKKNYIFKPLFIALVVSMAILATVEIRGNMHQILAKDHKVEQLKDTMEDEKNPFKDNLESSEEGGFGSDDADGFGGGFGDDDAQEASSASISKADQIDTLRDEVNADKDATAWLFTIINVFIVVGGLFLSYETHTSSRIYETIEKHIRKLEKLKKALERELKELDEEIMEFKNSQVNRLFKKLLLKAALYDKEVRTYNTYMHIFELKMQLVQDYIKKIYEEKDVAYSPIEYVDVLDGRVTMDYRKELHHVHNIEEYMIYNYSQKEEYKNFKTQQKESENV